MIIAIADGHGRVVKSMLAANLAVMRARRGKQVLLLDGDPRKFSVLWGEDRQVAGARPALHTRQLARQGVARQLESLASDYDDVIIDADAADSLPARSVLVFAHQLVVLLHPAQFEQHVQDTLRQRLDTARLFNPRMKVLFVIAFPDVVIPLHDIARIRAFVVTIPCARLADVSIHPTHALSCAFASGLAAVEYASEDVALRRQMEDLYRAVFPDEAIPLRGNQQAISHRGFREQVTRLRGIIFKLLP